MQKSEIGRVKFSFAHRHDDEIDVKFNDIVRIVQADCGVEGWSEIEFNGKIGKVPSGYIQTLPSPYEGAVGKASFNYVHQKEAETGQFLTLTEGDEVLVIDRPVSGWCVGILRSHLGLFPENYVTFSNTSNFSELEDLLRTLERDEYIYSRILCAAVDVSSAESLARDLILIFEKDNKVFDLISNVIDTEVNQTINEGTLFRKNSLSSHLMSQYARLIGKEYICSTLRPLIRGIISANADFEIDPHKINDSSKMEKNVAALERAAQDFLLDMMGSVNKFPMALRRMCQYLQKSVVEKFPQAKRKVIGGFFFLRLICPAVVSPEGFGVVDHVDDNTRRSLILISKIMQTLSNGVMFGVKEEYMKPMNKFITENLENSHFLLDKLAQAHPDIPSERLPELNEEDSRDLQNRVHNTCSLCKAKFFRLLHEENIDEDMIRKIAGIIIRLGQTPKKKLRAAVRPPPSASSSSGILRDSTPDKKKLRAKEKEREREEKREKKQREREKKNAAARPNPISPPAGTVLVKSVLQPRNNKQLRKRVYALFSSSTRIYAFNSTEDPPNSFVDSIELSPSYEVSLVGRTKAGWEFSIRTLKCEYWFVCNLEEDMRSWVAYLDRRKKEIMMPNADKAQKLELVDCLEMKMKGYVDDKEATKLKLKNTTDPDVIAAESRRVEEIVIMMDTLQRSIDAAKSSLGQ